MRLSIGHLSHKLTHTFVRPPGFPYWTMSLLLSGRVLIRAAGREGVKQGPLLTLVSPRCPYDVRYGGTKGPWIEHWVIFSARREWEQWLAFPALPPLPNGYGALALPDRQLVRTITRLIVEAEDVMRSTLPQREALAFNAIERVLLLADTINPQAAHARLDPRVRAAVEHVSTHLDQPLDVDELARSVHMSPSHFAHLFREQMDQPPMVYVERQRIDRAQELLLTTNLPVSEIAGLTGFTNPFHFSTRFRRRTGKSPRAFRHEPR